MPAARTENTSPHPRWARLLEKVAVGGGDVFISRDIQGTELISNLRQFLPECLETPNVRDTNSCSEGAQLTPFYTQLQCCRPKSVSGLAKLIPLKRPPPPPPRVECISANIEAWGAGVQGKHFSLFRMMAIILTCEICSVTLGEKCFSIESKGCICVFAVWGGISLRPVDL